VKVDGALLATALAKVPEQVRSLERAGYDGIFTFEGPHDPFFPLVLAAEHSKRLELSTQVAIAFARNPMIVAHMAHDLHTQAEGRFRLGLGSQVKPHIEKRYSATWSRPAARMKEFIQALRAIWASWNDGEPLRFEGTFYRHTLMTPAFKPGPCPHGSPPVWLAGVGPRITEVAGEVADGMIVHPFNSECFVAETTVPAIERGLARAGRERKSFELVCQVLVVTGDTDADFEAAADVTRYQIAFYASTPAYRGVLDAEGWGDTQDELNGLAKQGRWSDMGTLVTDELLERIAVCGRPHEIATKLRARYGLVADRIALASPYALDAACLHEIVSGLRA
jgi:probable F420-dependent oxidoreductase